jgi:hypothetical protein
MTDKTERIPEENTEVEAHSVLDAQDLDDGTDEVEAHSCISVLSSAAA